MIPADIGDYRELARRRLPRFLFDYIDGGSVSEATLKANTSDFARVKLRQRVLRDVSEVKLSTSFFGQAASMPVALAPVGLSGLYARRGEAQAARAAAKAGVPFSLSSLGVCSMEEVSAATGEPIWFQLYVIKDRGFNRAMIERAKASGASALLFTVDLPVAGSRYADIRSGLANPHAWTARFERWKALASRPGWVWDVGVNGRPHDLGNVAEAVGPGASTFAFWDWVGRNFDASITWKDIDFIRETWDGPLVIKGVLDPEDARTAVSAGAEGIVVSNHGGRQLDGCSSSIAALPRIAEAVGGKTTVLLDGGVRSGLDVVRAVASGAKGVLIGRAWAYALAARGGAGVSTMLETFRKEISTTLKLIGQPDIGKVGRDDLDLS
ncbi:MAG: L-lactate dehydrogenase [Proteobacteria bacterium]|nr:L-lactate dehydrogenase [Pseudomonadota bacterium]